MVTYRHRLSYKSFFLSPCGSYHLHLLSYSFLTRTAMLLSYLPNLCTLSLHPRRQRTLRTEPSNRTNERATEPNEAGRTNEAGRSNEASRAMRVGDRTDETNNTNCVGCRHPATPFFCKTVLSFDVYCSLIQVFHR